MRERSSNVLGWLTCTVLAGWLIAGAGLAGAEEDAYLSPSEVCFWLSPAHRPST